MSSVTGQTDATLVQAVRDAFSARARLGTDLDSGNVAQAFRYTPEQLQEIAAGSNMGLSCGNPVAAASIKPGERILDLGSRGGIDILLAASKVGPTGQAIGLDISPDMVSLSRRNAQKQNLRPPQVAFVQASLTDTLPISSNSIDCILSNCVVNLLPLTSKAKLFKEAFRVLKSGGRIVLDDIVAKKALPDIIRNDFTSYIAGAIELDVYKCLLSEVGFTDVVFVDTLGDLSVYYTVDNAGCCSTPLVNDNVGCCCCTSAPGAPQPSSVNIEATAAGCCPTSLSNDTSSSPQPSSTKFEAPAAEHCSPSLSNNNLGCCTSAPSAPGVIFDANEYGASYQIYALKPMSSSNTTVEATDVLLRWWDAYPAGKSSAPLISSDDVASLLRDNTLGQNDYAVIDVRRSDHAGGHVRDSIQYSAQTFYDDLPGFFDKYGHTSKVIFYCTSSRGRGPRCAGWYQDYLNDNGVTSSKAYILEGGIKTWLKKFGEDVTLVDKD